MAALRLFLCFTILVATSYTLSAQTLKGKVVDAESHQVLYPVTVVNIRTQQSTYSQPNGTFEIDAHKGDKLVFTYVGYNTYHYLVTAVDNIVPISVQLRPKVYSLDEFIFAPGLTQYQIDSIERAETYTPVMSRRKSSIMSPVSFLAERLSKRSKRIFKFQKDFNYWEGQRFIDTRYTTDLVEELTDLTGDSLAHFMNSNPMPFDYARTATPLELKMWIRTKYREWLATLDTLKPSTPTE